MTAHEHHTHPETGHGFCCCGWGFPTPERSGESLAGLPTWAAVNARPAARYEVVRVAGIEMDPPVVFYAAGDASPAAIERAAVDAMVRHVA